MMGRHPRSLRRQQHDRNKYSNCFVNIKQNLSYDNALSERLATTVLNLITWVHIHPFFSIREQPGYKGDNLLKLNVSLFKIIANFLLRTCPHITD